jgi:GH15 family glucan-1,4-alpha-glucosidase
VKSALGSLGSVVEPPGITSVSRPLPDIRELAFLSDQETVAVLDPYGSVLWLCIPRTDSPAICSRLIDPIRGGFIRVSPAEVQVPCDRRYVPGTNVLSSTYQTPTGGTVVIDACLAIGTWPHTTERSATFVRVPRDHRAEHTLVWRVRCWDVPSEVVLDFAPRPNNGAEQVHWEQSDPCMVQAQDGERTLKVIASRPLGITALGGRAMAQTTVRPGETVYVAFTWGSGRRPRTAKDFDRIFGDTVAFWRGELAKAHIPDVPERPFLTRAVLTLLGLIDAPNGGVWAAGTTSLPAIPAARLTGAPVEENRGWDYRYAWLRDSSHVLSALLLVGLDGYVRAFLDWLLTVVEQGPLQIMYTTDGKSDLKEVILKHPDGYQPPGYKGAGPVRIGNGAATQIQNDSWGHVVHTILLAVRDDRSRLDHATWRKVVKLVQTAEQVWMQPDSGIWEGRSENLHRYTSSAIMCAIALRDGAELADLWGESAQAAEWRKLAGQIKEDIHTYGVKNRVLVQLFTDDGSCEALDASVLLGAIFDLFDPGVPEDLDVLRATVRAIEEKLMVDGLVKRYRHDEGASDSFSEGEDAFIVCSFWLVEVYEMIGEHANAEDLLARVLRLASPLQLYAECVDPRTGQQTGNFPLGYSMLGGVWAVMAVARGRSLAASASTSA